MVTNMLFQGGNYLEITILHRKKYIIVATMHGEERRRDGTRMKKKYW